MKIKNKLKDTLASVKAHWSTPPEGRYMPYREIASLSVGGIGVRVIVYCVNNMIISVGNALIGNTIGIDPSALYVIYILGILSSFPLTAIRARMIDNARSMKGKYRPYLLTMGIPTVLLGIGFVWMPYENMGLTAKCVTVLLYNVAFQFFFNFLSDSYNSLINVLSPNTIERSDVLSIKSIVENISPSVINIVLPLAANLITGDNSLYDIRIYRYIYPPMLILGFLLSLLVYVNVNEKIVQAKTHVIRVKFIDAFRAIAQNKYFWIISLAGWLGFLESAFSSILGWMYNYQNACSPGQYSIITALAGNASFWPNLIAPFLIRKYGKKKILITANLLNVVFIASMLPVIKQTGSASVIWMLLVCIFINQFLTAMGDLLSPSIQADIRDYQQYKTGERIDGMFAAVGLIGSVITLLTGSVLPTIYEKAGLNKDVALSLGYDASNVYNVLYNTPYFIRICSILVISSVIGAALNAIPFFFYDLTEAHQKAIVKVLKIRALFEDMGNNVVSEEALAETTEIISETLEYAEREIPVPSKEELKAARASHDKERIKKAKEDYRNRLEEKEKADTAAFVLAELKKYETPEGKAELDLAEKISSAGLNGFADAVTLSKQEIRMMPRDTAAQKELRKTLFRLMRDIKSSEKAVKKYYPNGIEPFDTSVFESLFKQEDDTELEKQRLLGKLRLAENGKKSAESAQIKRQIREVSEKKRAVAAEIKEATDKNSIYYRAAKPYLDAVKTIAQYKNYSNVEEIFGLQGTKA